MNIGVVVYCKNNQDTVFQAIDSVLHQTLKPHSMVIIDDASNDGSWKKICNRLDVTSVDETEIQTTINDIKIIAKSNEFEDGPVWALHSGTSLVWEECDWFGFLFASGYYLPEKIKRSMSHMEDENFSHVYSDFYYTTNGSPIRAYYSSHWTDHPDVGFFRKQALERINLVKIRTGTFDNLNQILRANFLVAHIPEALQYANYQE